MTIYVGGQQPGQKMQVNSTVLQQSFNVLEKMPEFSEVKNMAIPEVINLWVPALVG